MNLQVEIIRDEDAFQRLEPYWWQLWMESISATPFQSPAWLLPWWQAFSPGDLATIAVWAGNELTGLAPLYLERCDSGPRLLPVGISLSDYLDVLCRPGSEAAVSAAMAEAVLSFQWSQWILPDLATKAAAMALTLPAAQEDRCANHAACPVLRLAGSHTLDDTVPARRRRQLRRAHKAARRRDRVDIRRAETDAETFLGHLFRLHGARWDGQGGGVLSDAAAREFHSAALPRLAAKDLARCWLIEIGDTVVGAYYGFQHRDRAYAYLGGFDPAYAAESPGAILIGQAIADAIREGAREFDFLRGQESYKYSWGALDRWTTQRVWWRETQT